jgi:putative ATP-dependent endonuclease of OLD family
MHDEIGFEDMVLNNTTDKAMERFLKQHDLPKHQTGRLTNQVVDIRMALGKYFADSKGNWGIADFLAQCNVEEIPKWLKDAAHKLKTVCIETTVDCSEVDLAAKVDNNEATSTDRTD